MVNLTLVWKSATMGWRFALQHAPTGSPTSVGAPFLALSRQW